MSTHETSTHETSTIAAVSTLHLPEPVVTYLCDNADNEHSPLQFAVWAGTYGLIIAIRSPNVYLGTYRLDDLPAEHVHESVRWRR